MKQLPGPCAEQGEEVKLRHDSHTLSPSPLDRFEVCALTSLWLRISGKPSFLPLTELWVLLLPAHVRCLDPFNSLCFWAAMGFVFLLPFHGFLLWALQLQLTVEMKNGRNYCGLAAQGSWHCAKLGKRTWQKLFSHWLNCVSKQRLLCSWVKKTTASTFHFSQN